MGLKEMKIKIGPELEKKVSFLASQCGLEEGDFMSAVMVLDAFHKGWIREPQPKAEE